MRYQFKPKLIPSLITLILITVLINLGVWQLTRAQTKTLLKNQYQTRSNTIIRLSDLKNNTKDLRFYHVKLTGTFDNQHNILLDNKIFHHQVGYDIITPFYIFGSTKIILVNRGWISQGQSRATLPNIEPLFGEQKLEGTLGAVDQGSGMLLGPPDVFKGTWPWLVQKIDLAELSKLFNTNFYPYIVNQKGVELPITNLQPEKHIAYAIQWFLLALALLIFYCFLSVKKKP